MWQEGHSALTIILWQDNLTLLEKLYGQKEHFYLFRLWLFNPLSTRIRRLFLHRHFQVIGEDEDAKVLEGVTSEEEVDSEDEDAKVMQAGEEIEDVDSEEESVEEVEAVVHAGSTD